MPSLTELLNTHPALLLIDSSSARVQIGLWRKEASVRWAICDTEASTGIFALVDELLREAGLRIAEIDAFIFCEGPGSVLGIRTAAVALRSWRVINPSAGLYTYQSLELVARSLNQPDVKVIADARRDSWHVAQIGQPLRRVAAGELSGSLVMPAHFRHWTPLPAGVACTPYELAALLENLANDDVFRATEEPDAFSHEEPSYVTWTPQIHQSPRTS